MWYAYRAFVKLVAYFTVETGNTVRDTIIDISTGILAGKHKIEKAVILEVENETLEDREGRLYALGGELKRCEMK